jgi:hypothetical protein
MPLSGRTVRPFVAAMNEISLHLECGVRAEARVHPLGVFGTTVDWS